MGLDDTLKNQLRAQLRDLKPKFVQEFDELTQEDVEEAGDDPDKIVDRSSRRAGQPRNQVEQRVRQVANK